MGSSGSSKSTTHEPIDTEDVTQWMGPGSRTYTVDGACFPGDETTVERLYEVPQIKARLPDRGTLDVTVEDYDISPTRTRYSRDVDGDDDPETVFLKEFSLTLKETSPTGADSPVGGGGGSSDINPTPDTPSSL
ncbi:hypothetical protein C449_00920 [Halococcus saccharolyticus DSM 5350]|uniref:Uncharacterized protein n=2 Tax=Halococcus saccharolyticus TaxID=62319 RepID=M0MU77_9EURY|nr:hypothetical protein C449_00920 [Halococcus saccharolyticus DSM 5350]